jgi:hypothetical protein
MVNTHEDNLEGASENYEDNQNTAWWATHTSKKLISIGWKERE